MPVRKLFTSNHDSDAVLEVVAVEGSVEISAFYLTGESHGCGFVLLDPDDIPALCRELLRVAKLAKACKEPRNGNP